jgi:hypothetical protein
MGHQGLAESQSAVLLISAVTRQRAKYRDVAVDAVAALREAEQALERGDVDVADRHLEDYDGFQACGGQEPPEGATKYRQLSERLRALRTEA